MLILDVTTSRWVHALRISILTKISMNTFTISGLGFLQEQEILLTIHISSTSRDFGRFVFENLSMSIWVWWAWPTLGHSTVMEILDGLIDIGPHAARLGEGTVRSSQHFVALQLLQPSPSSGAGGKLGCWRQILMSLQLCGHLLGRIWLSFNFWNDCLMLMAVADIFIITAAAWLLNSSLITASFLRLQFLSWAEAFLPANWTLISVRQRLVASQVSWITGSPSPWREEPSTRCLPSHWLIQHQERKLKL